MLTAEDQMAIEGQLTDFLKKSEAQWSALVDKGGNLFAQSGDTGTLDLSILSALAAGSFAATHELAKRLGESEFSALYHEGHGQHILMSALHHECLLVTIFGEKTNIGLVRFYAQQVTATLNAALKQASEKEATAAPLQLEGDFLSNTATIS
ncbi:MAG TPA: roadblock/LC7 domain-containing protein [Candidatus Methylacidiphilales bacterium]|nr:roadblock/LC7 domain-containing protein [Candidatus Methylacidiphilales bacterium]